MSTSDHEPAGAQPGAGSSATPSASGRDASQGQYPQGQTQDPQGYGQQGYGQQGYGRRPGRPVTDTAYGQPPTDSRRTASRFPATARRWVTRRRRSSAGRPTRWRSSSLVMAFVFAPAGLVLGILARKQIARTGRTATAWRWPGSSSAASSPRSSSS